MVTASRRRPRRAVLAGPLVVAAWLGAWAFGAKAGAQAPMSPATAPSDTPALAPRTAATHVRFTAPAHCGTQAVFEGHLQRFLGREGLPLELGLEVVARVRRGPARAYVLVLDIQGPDVESSRRIVEHPSRCTLLVEIAALIVAMAVDPDAALRFGPELLAERGLVVSEQQPSPNGEGSSPNGERSADPASPELEAPAIVEATEEAETPPSELVGPSEPVAPVEPEVAPVPIVPAATRPRRIELRLGAFAGIDHGPVGRLSGTAQLGFGLVRGRVRADLVAAFDGIDQVRIDPASGAAITLRAFSVAALGCWHEARGRLELEACARLDVGATSATPTRVLNPVSHTRAHVRVGFEPRVAFRVLDSGSVGLRGSLGYTAYEPRFGLVDAGTLSLVPRLAVALTLGGEWRWN